MLINLTAALLMLASGAGDPAPENGVQAIGASGCKTWKNKEDNFRSFECSKPLSLSVEERRRPFISEISKRAGAGAVLCGYVGLGDPAQAAFECGERAEREKVAFLLGLQEHSWDTEAWEGALRTPSGEGYLVRYETDPSGDLEIPPSFVWKACQRFEFITSPSPGILCRE